MAMSDINCEEIETVLSLTDEKLFGDALDLCEKVDIDDFLSLKTDVDWFVNELNAEDAIKGQEFSRRDSSSMDQDEEDMINGLLSKNFGNMEAVCEVKTEPEDFSDDEVMQKLIEIQEEQEYFPLTEDEVPKAVSTITVDGDSECNTNDDDDEEEDDSLSMSPPTSQSAVEIHHNYCCSQKLESSSYGVGSYGSHGRGRGSRSKAITDLVLTDEERRLLAKEGYQDFPSGTTALTKQEEKILRKIRRKIRNKRSAQCSRQRKKEYLDDLERKYEKCSNDNHILRRENLKLRKANESLLMKLKRLLLLQGSSSGQTSFKTSFFVLIISFLLIIFPYFRPDSFDDNAFSFTKGGDFMGTGRQLLTVATANDTEPPSVYYSVYYDLNDSLTAMLDIASDLSSLREL